MQKPATCATLALLVLLAAWWTGFTPATLLSGLPHVGQYFGKIFSILPRGASERIPVLAPGHLFGGVREPQSFAYWFYRLGTYLQLLWQTIEMAVVATVVGGAGAFLLSFPAARTLGAPAPVRVVTRRVLELFRSIPQIVLAFILVWPFGVGPLAGIAAIAVHTAGALGKLFAELNENADMRPAEGIRAAGGSWFAIMRYAMVPQMMPGFLSYLLLRFEINVRVSTIIGFVGAGGIGQEFRRVISFNIYEEVSAIAILIVILVGVLDIASERVRGRFIAAALARR